MTSSNLQSLVFIDDAVRLHDLLTWIYGVEKNLSLFDWMLKGKNYRKQITKLCEQLPLRAIDIECNNDLRYFHDWFEDAQTDSYWSRVNHRPSLRAVTARPLLIAGWYDLFLRDQLKDYEILRAEGLDPYLTITPFTHTLLFSMPSFIKDKDPLVLIRESIAWLDTHLKGKNCFREKPIRYYELISNQWIETESWPPLHSQELFYLYPHGILGRNLPPTDATPDFYVYNPARPTPALGGAIGDVEGGPIDNSLLIQRNDVLTYTTAPLEEDLAIAGPVRLRLYISSSLENTDFYGRLCVVYPNGLSVNLCDGLYRLNPGKGERQADDTLKIEIDMWSTAARFEAGLRIQLLVASGAFPRWSRNLGYGDTLGAGKRIQIAEQTVYHDRDHPSALILPQRAYY
jgi:putative CocE/NonD family hydrolase